MQHILELCESLADYANSERVLFINETREPFWNGGVGVNVDSSNQWYSPIEPLYHKLDHMIRTASPSLCEHVLTNDRFLTIENDLHQLRAAYENDKELVQARIILQNRAKAGRSQLDNLLLQESYWSMTSELIEALPNKQNILVAGSGALPLTGISIAHTHRVDKVTCLESDPKAFFFGELIINLSGYAIDSINADILSQNNLEQYDAIVGVVLLGIDPHTGRNYKADVVQHILSNVSRDATVILRVPHGLGRLLYPSVELGTVKGFEVQHTIPEVDINHPYRSATITARRL